MRHPLRAIALALALSAVPACAHLPSFESPIAAAHSNEQRAYALLRTYAVVLEEASDIVRDPNAPSALKRALGEAERVATPAAETLGVAMRAYIGARAELDAAPRSTNAAAALAIAADHLINAAHAAQRPIGELEALVRELR